MMQRLTRSSFLETKEFNRLNAILQLERNNYIRALVAGFSRAFFHIARSLDDKHFIVHPRLINFEFAARFFRLFP
jgi:hypothetical protein